MAGVRKRLSALHDQPKSFLPAFRAQSQPLSPTQRSLSASLHHHLFAHLHPSQPPQNCASIYLQTVKMSDYGGDDNEPVYVIAPLFSGLPGHS